MKLKETQLFYLVIETFFPTCSIVYKDHYVQFVYMPPPVPNPLNLPISHTFLQTMYVQMQQKTEGLGKI